jgi:hypothetical protein
LIQKEVEELFSEILQSESLYPKSFSRNNSDQNRVLMFEQLIGPITIKCLISKKDVGIEPIVQRAFDCFKLQYGIRTIKTAELRDFITSTLNYLLFKIKTVERSRLKLIVEKLGLNFLI